jgi:methionyl-tRNA formyltransferase
MNIVFVAAQGPFALESLRALAAHHRIAAVVRPARGGPLKRGARFALQSVGLYSGDIVSNWTRESGIPTITAASRADQRVVEALRRHAPDLLCIAGFPWLLPDEILAMSPAGVLNLHPSLLPRHRGTNPFFWTYYHDDRETGVTVHTATAQPDAGPILAQHSTPLPRALPLNELYHTLASEGARLFVEAVGDVQAGRAIAIAQDESRATPAPRVPPGAAMVDFGSWDAERVWHFLAGLGHRFREPLRDGTGRPIRYRGVTGYERCQPGGPIGTVARTAFGWNLWCRDGAVRLSREAN